MELIIIIVVLALAIALGLAILPYLGWIIGIVVVLAVTVGALRILLSIWNASVEKLRSLDILRPEEPAEEANRPRHARVIDVVILGTAGVLLTGLAILSAIALNFVFAVLLGAVNVPILRSFFCRWRGIRQHTVLNDIG